MSVYRAALLDALDARDAVVREHAEDAREALMPHVARVVARAARRGATIEDVDDVAAPLGRLASLVALHLVDPAHDYLDAHLERRRAARREDPTGWTLGPVRKQERDERRRARLDAGGATLERVDALSGGGRVPDLDRIGRLTDAETNLLLRRFGVQEDRGAMLRREVVRASERLVGATSPSATLQDRVLDRAEAAVRRHLQTAAKAQIREYQVERLVADDPDVLLRWVAVLDDGTCEDCSALDLHGAERTLAEWRRYGMPGNGSLVCDGQCRCELEEA